MIEFFKGLGEHLGVGNGWGNSEWWLPIEFVIGRINSCRKLGSDTTGTRPLWVHSMLEIYLRENIESIHDKADFDRFVRKFMESTIEYIEQYTAEDDAE